MKSLYLLFLLLPLSLTACSGEDDEKKARLDYVPPAVSSANSDTTFEMADTEASKPVNSDSKSIEDKKKARLNFTPEAVSSAGK